MQESEFPFESDEPSEQQLREMLEARELEKELERKRMSRKLTKILCIAVILLAGLILCFPASREIFDPATRVNPDVALAKAAVAGQHAAGVPEELKPFTIKPGQDTHRDDMRFARELLDFIRPQAPSPQSAPDVPAKSP